MLSDANAPISASQPNKSIWVSANAGSGKTRNLVTRVARLVLLGVRPEKILCLTYTAAAASEMQERLMKELGSWSMMCESELYDTLIDLNDGLSPTNLDRKRLLSNARRLFAKVLETPGGLKIQTIHSFCASVIRKFPLEVNIAPNFVVLDDRQKKEIISQTISYIAKHHSNAFEKLIAELRTLDVNHLIDLILTYRSSLHNRFEIESFCNCFNLTVREINSSNELERIFDNLPKDTIYILAKNLLRGSKTDIKQAEFLKNFNERSNCEKLTVLEKIFLTKDGRVRSLRNYPSKSAKLLEPGLENLFKDLQLNFMRYISRRNQVSLIKKTRCLYEFSNTFLRIYEGFKTVDNALDYDDLITKTNILLTDYNSKWVQFRLDGGIDHILLDEAQDTSRSQWQMLAALTDDFFSDSRIIDGLRTFYAVGDEKQSIYSFQGADINDFIYMKAFFAKKMSLLGTKIHNFSLLKSFRSSKAILNFVNEIFLDGGETGVKDVREHVAYNKLLPGKVELWPLFPPQKTRGKSNWWTFEKILNLPSASDSLAKKIATEVKTILRSKQTISYTDSGHKIFRRSILPGDFLILVRSRGRLFNSLLKEFNKARLPIDGSDRLFLLDELAIRDIISLLKFLSNPSDDLSLAEALKSPLFGFSEQQLFDISYEREGTLYTSLTQIYPEYEACKILKDLLDHSRSLKPYDLLERILVNHEGRLKITARLGEGVNDALDEFLSQALSYEQFEPPSVFGFLKWLEGFYSSIKRQFSRSNSKIRIMTIHGAKGLESEIVILTETMGKSKIASKMDFLQRESWVCVSERDDLLPETPKKIKKEKEIREEEEENRLLYVAITRAKNWLIICGLGTEKETMDNKNQTKTWYQRSKNALLNLNPIKVCDSQNPKHIKLVYELKSNAVETKKPADNFEPTKSTFRHINNKKALSQIIHNELYLEQKSIHRLVATEFYENIKFEKNLEKKQMIKKGSSTDNARVYGSAVHLFLQYIPCFEERQYSYLKELIYYHFLSESENFQTIQNAFSEGLAVLKNPKFKFLSNKHDVLREVSVIGSLEGISLLDTEIIKQRSFFGRIDFLHLTDQKALIIDFKTNSKIPLLVESVEASHLAQVGIYLKLVEKAYPNREVSAAILWTKNASLMEIPPKLAFEALNTILNTATS